MPERYAIDITRRARKDLEEILEYICRDSPQRAAIVVARVLDEIRALQFLPARCRVVGKSRKWGSDIHVRAVRPFIVYYRIDEADRRVFVVEVRHGARQ